MIYGPYDFAIYILTEFCWIWVSNSQNSIFDPIFYIRFYIREYSIRLSSLFSRIITLVRLKFYSEKLRIHYWNGIMIYE